MRFSIFTKVSYPRFAFTITAGYSPIGKWINFDCVKFYENLAKKIAHKHFKTLEDRQKAHKKLIQRFLKELINYN